MKHHHETIFTREKGIPRKSPVRLYKEVLPVPNQNFSLPVRIFLHRKKIHAHSPLLFLVNGFAADYKTFTFRPLREKGAFAPSFAEFMAEQGFIVVVKCLGSERARFENSFSQCVKLVPDYTKAVIEHVPPLLRNITGISVQTKGIHWIGHSLGGMVAAATPVKTGIESFVALASPTYMYFNDERLIRLLRLIRPLLPFPRLNRRIPIPITLAEDLLDYMLNRFGIESYRKLSHDQHLLIGLMLHLPFVRTLSHLALNMDHLDFETAAAFMRSATANENLQLLIDFIDGILVNGKEKGAILKQPLIPFSVPTLVIGGEGDDIAPVHSVVHLLTFVKRAQKEKMIFRHYDHLGLLLKYAARFDVWPAIVAFVYAQAIKNNKLAILHRQAQQTISSLCHDPRLGNKSCKFTQKIMSTVVKKHSQLRIVASQKA